MRTSTDTIHELELTSDIQMALTPPTAVNPKQVQGLKKVPYSYLPSPFIAGTSLAMYEGRKYGRHNYRSLGSVKASIYYDAMKRHLDAWYEGQDIDPFSGLHHLFKASACIAILTDSMVSGRFEDDRPPKLPDNWIEEFNKMVAVVNDHTPNPVEPFTELTNGNRVPDSRSDQERNK